MDLETVEGYWMAITQIEAQETLIQLRVSQYPWLSKEGRSRTHRQLHRLAYPVTHKPADQMTTEQVAERFKAVING